MIETNKKLIVLYIIILFYKCKLKNKDLIIYNIITEIKANKSQ